MRIPVQPFCIPHCEQKFSVSLDSPTGLEEARWLESGTLSSALPQWLLLFS